MLKIAGIHSKNIRKFQYGLQSYTLVRLWFHYGKKRDLYMNNAWLKGISSRMVEKFTIVISVGPIFHVFLLFFLYLCLIKLG